MSLTIEELEMEALQLPARSRVDLAGRLMDSIETDAASDAVVEQAWLAEAIRRRDEVRQGKAKTVPAETVFAEVRALLRK
jgi:putative addiction module component (TIGR02574 family)